jgi:aminobenzoyl-glutamate utilization protein B
LRDKVTPLKKWPPDEEERMPTGGGSDDVGDIMWTVPTITIRYPSNIPSTIAHNVTAAMAMATPIAHKGAVAGAKAVAMTVLDLMTTPETIVQAKDFFQNTQLKEQKYVSLLAPGDLPAIHLNDELMGKMRPLMEKFYYNPAKYDTYLDQLGIQYPSGTMETPSQSQPKSGQPLVN